MFLDISATFRRISSRGDAAATWIFRGRVAATRRGHNVAIPWTGRGCDADIPRTGRGDAAAWTWIFCGATRRRRDARFPRGPANAATNARRRSLRRALASRPRRPASQSAAASAPVSSRIHRAHPAAARRRPRRPASSTCAGIPDRSSYTRIFAEVFRNTTLRLSIKLDVWWSSRGSSTTRLKSFVNCASHCECVVAATSFAPASGSSLSASAGPDPRRASPRARGRTPARRRVSASAGPDPRTAGLNPRASSARPRHESVRATDDPRGGCGGAASLLDGLSSWQPRRSL